MQAAIGNGMFLGVVMAVIQYSGGSLLGKQANAPELEGRWPTKEEHRKRFRRPVNETINELGEGRGMCAPRVWYSLLIFVSGIYGPGYEERRKQRLKENYGIEVPEPFYKV
jgi:hypothetical protein